ncbi:hypothetical protein LMG8286_01807 [Campylobacter suis]|uniref:Histidine kinase domain-containing protein n=2 Tax=Campylobacter suis TaxID=2790657 RepID=A0ABN7KAF3_9BACT|nr:hypothetical protein LMG8286_01807 [Campylobacter suis]
MKRLFSYSKSVDFKFYLIIFIASFMFLAYGIRFYNDTKNGFIELSNEGKANITKNLVGNFNAWINERSNMLVNVSKIIEGVGAVNNNDKLDKILKTFYQNSNDFHIVQFLKDDGTMHVNGDGSTKKRISERLSLIWRIQTKDDNKTTLTYMPKHYQLLVPTLNICVPNHLDNDFIGVLCGVIKLEDIFTNIKNFNLPLNAYSIIITHSGEVLTPMKDEKLKVKIEQNLKERLLVDEEISGLSINSNFIALSEIPSLNWYIGVGANDTKGIKDLLGNAQKNAFALFVAFIFLSILANFLHNYMYKRLRDKNEEYEILLRHKAKMAETGELIAGINHQFIQPINSLKLMISTLLVLKKEKSLSDDELEEMLQNGKDSVKLLGDTVEIFRNFYKTSENIEDFEITQSINNLLMLMHTELSRANVKASVKTDKKVYLIQKQNIIQQILLILIHNAKDALVEKHKNDIEKRKIDILISSDDTKCHIAVHDLGNGISDEMKNKIFSTPQTTKKTGNGIGLYFGKKLANEKINGDIVLKSLLNPTIFELNFDIHLKA